MKEKEKEERMRRCNHHVFCVIQKGYNDQDIYFNPIIECVKCGLTNKHIHDDEFHSWLFNCEYESMESRVYKELMNINPDEYQGFAFGFGWDRMAMLKYDLNDIRAFYDGDVRWLKNSGF